MKNILLKSSFYLVTVFLIKSSIFGQNINLIKKNKWAIYSSVSAKPIDLNNRGTSSTNVLAQGPDCVLDDIFIFQNNNVFILDENRDFCEDSKLKKGVCKPIGSDSIMIKFRPNEEALRLFLLLKTK